jgi:hypothetical protein
MQMMGQEEVALNDCMMMVMLIWGNKLTALIVMSPIGQRTVTVSIF